MREATSLLRIEDTDQERYVEGAVDIIYRTHGSWPGWSMTRDPIRTAAVGPYVQSERQAGRHLSGVCQESWLQKGEAEPPLL